MVLNMLRRQSYLEAASQQDQLEWALETTTLPVDKPQTLSHLSAGEHEAIFANQDLGKLLILQQLRLFVPRSSCAPLPLFSALLQLVELQFLVAVLSRVDGAHS